MKKFMFLFISVLGVFSFSNIVKASEEPIYNPISGYLTKEVDPNEFEVYDEQGNLIDSSGFKFIEHVPLIQSRSTIYSKYVTTYVTHSTPGWDNSIYLRWSGGWQGTVYYQSYYLSEVLWGWSYQVNYAGTLYRWAV